MNTPAGQRWRVRMAEGLDTLAAWAQEKGAWRWVGCGVGLILVAVWWFGLRATSNGGVADVMGHGLLCFAALVAGAVLISPMLVPLAARPVLRFIDTIYLGGSSIEPPPLTYVVADRRMQEGRYEDAAAEFERLAYWHPYDVRSYVEGIRAARLAGDERAAGRLFRRGFLRCPAALDQLRLSMRTERAKTPERAAWQSQTGV